MNAANRGLVLFFALVIAGTLGACGLLNGELDVPHLLYDGVAGPSAECFAIDDGCGCDDFEGDSCICTGPECDCSYDEDDDEGICSCDGPECFCEESPDTDDVYCAGFDSAGPSCSAEFCDCVGRDCHCPNIGNLGGRCACVGPECSCSGDDCVEFIECAVDMDCPPLPGVTCDGEFCERIVDAP